MDVEQRLQPTNNSNELHYPEHQNHGIQRITIFLTDEDENDLKIEESEEEETIEDTHEVKSSFAPSEAEFSRSNGRLKKNSDKPKLKRGRKRKQKTDVNKNNETQEVISAKTDLEKPEEDEEEVTKKRRKSSYPCPHCHYVSSWKTNLEKHMMAQHTGERPYKCPHCEYASVHQNQLEKHWNTHHLGAVIHCSLCPFTVEAVEPYWKHMSQAHPGGRPVKCEECGRRVVSLSALELHILEKHAYTKPEFPCPHCGYRAAVEENQRTHIQSLHKCIDCGYRSDSLREVRRHRKREHRAPRQPRRRASLTTAPPSFPQSPPETNKLPMAALSPESSCNSE